MKAAPRSLAACVDIGGTKVAVSVADENSTKSRILHTRLSEPTAKTGDNTALATQITRLIHESARQYCANSYEIKSIGVSSCGPFLLQQGMIELAAPNICGGIAGAARGLPNDWFSAPLQAPLAAAFANITRNIRIEIDGIGALEAERRWGALQGIANCAYVTWSTGIGAGVCVDGRVLRGKNGNAGHMGHSFVGKLSENEDALCGCGNINDLEALIGGNALPRRFASLGFTDSAMIFRAACATSTIEFEEKDIQNAQKIIDEICILMGRALYNLIVLFDLERISVGGSLFLHNQDILLPKLHQFLSGKLPALTAGCEIVPAGLGLEVGDLGALALCQSG